MARPCAVRRRRWQRGARGTAFGLAVSWVALGGLPVSAQEGAGAGATGGPEPTPFMIDLVSGNGQSWFLGRQLRDPVVFRISAPQLGADGCQDLRVLFTSEDAVRVSPIVGDPTWEGGDCLVRTWWTLGSDIGRQHLRAEIPGATARRATAHAVARQGARLFFGGAWTPRQDGWTELRDTEAGPSIRNVEPMGAFRPILGVDFAIWPSRERLRLSAAAASPHLDQFFFFGFSGLQAFLFGPAQEGSPVDLHLGFQLSRREVGLSGDACSDGGVCTARDLRFGGISVLVTVDGASAFRGLAGVVLR